MSATAGLKSSHPPPSLMDNTTATTLRLHVDRNTTSVITPNLPAVGIDDDNVPVIMNHNPRARHPRTISTDLKTRKETTTPPTMAVMTTPPPPQAFLPPKGPAFASLTKDDALGLVRSHPIPCVFTLCLLLFMGVEYTIPMVPFNSPPLDIGFLLTTHLNAAIAASDSLNSLLAALNTVFVVMQTSYILWAFLVEGRPRSAFAAVFMFTCRGVLGCCTQLPLPRDFVGSGMDFPVGNVSFFLFFSGHVAGAVIASLDMRRSRRRSLAWMFDVINALQVVRLVATRGHYTIDLAVGVGAGLLFDSLAGKYEKSKIHVGEYRPQDRACCSCRCR